MARREPIPAIFLCRNTQETLMPRIRTLADLQSALAEHYRNEHGLAMVRIAQTSAAPRSYCLTVHPAVPADPLRQSDAPLWGQALFTRWGRKADLLAELASPVTRPTAP